MEDQNDYVFSFHVAGITKRAADRLLALLLFFEYVFPRLSILGMHIPEEADEEDERSVAYFEVEDSNGETS